MKSTNVKTSNGKWNRDIVLSERTDYQEYLLDLTNKILHEATHQDVTLRLFGGVAIWTHCPKFRYLLEAQNRFFPDLDFVAHLRDVVEIQKLFINLGFDENKSIMRLFGNHRRIFILPNPNIHIDIVLDRLHFNHDINLADRLEIDNPTISLADLLLSKLQIVQLNGKDMLDIIVLLLEHDVGSGNNETIDLDYIAKLCSNDWGLWKTIIVNCIKLRRPSSRYLPSQVLEDELCQKLTILEDKINAEKKSLKWRVRNLVGEKMKWYNDVEELERSQ